MKILILGHGGHGKSTLSERLSMLLGCTYASSSREALDVIWPALSLITKCTHKEQAYQDRSANRLLWKELIKLYNAADRTALAKRILAAHDIYDGMRDIDEFHASKHMFDLILYVDASGRGAPRDLSMQVPFDARLMKYVSNNGDKQAFEKEAIALYKFIRAMEADRNAKVQS